MTFELAKRVNSMSYPDRSAATEMISIINTVNRVVRPELGFYDPERNDFIAGKIADGMPKILIKGEPTDVNISIRIADVLCSGKINRSSSPGYPFMDCKTNGDVLDNHMPLLVSLVMTLLVRWRDIKYEELSMKSGRWLYENGYCHITRVMVKQEPHSKEKIEEGRVRTIGSASLVMQVALRCLNQELVTQEIEDHTFRNSKAGMGAEDQDFQLLSMYVDRISAMGCGPRDSDVSGFDTSVNEGNVDLTPKVLVKCHKEEEPPKCGLI